MVKKKKFSYFLKLSMCFKEMSNMVNAEIHRSDPIVLSWLGYKVHDIGNVIVYYFKDHQGGCSIWDCSAEFVIAYIYKKQPVPPKVTPTAHKHSPVLPHIKSSFCVGSFISWAASFNNFAISTLSTSVQALIYFWWSHSGIYSSFH